MVRGRFIKLAKVKKVLGVAAAEVLHGDVVVDAVRACGIEENAHLWLNKDIRPKSDSLILLDNLVNFQPDHNL